MWSHFLSAPPLFGILAILNAADAAASDFRIDGGESGWDQNAWYVQVDGVMGGLSSGGLQFRENRTTMAFSGDINLRGGGFSSVRRRFYEELDLSAFAGVVLTVEADPIIASVGTRTAPLGMHLQFGDSRSYPSFSSAFAIPLANDSAQEVSVFLPMESFDRGSYFGRQCRNCALDLTKINEMSFYVLFQEGPFDVRLKSVTAVKEAEVFAPLPIEFESSEVVERLLQATIYSGGSLYDKSYSELCIALYWSVLNTIIAAPAGVSESLREVACSGLAELSLDSSKAEKAWSLRRTMDAMLSDIEGNDRSSGSTGSDGAEIEAIQCVPRTSIAEGVRPIVNGTSVEAFPDSIETEGENPSPLSPRSTGTSRFVGLKLAAIAVTTALLCS